MTMTQIIDAEHNYLIDQPDEVTYSDYLTLAGTLKQVHPWWGDISLPAVKELLDGTVDEANHRDRLLVVREQATQSAVGGAILHLATQDEVDYVRLDELFVHPRVQGSGAGRLLLGAVMEVAEAEGADHIVSARPVHQENELPAYQLMTSGGFTVNSQGLFEREL